MREIFNEGVQDHLIAFEEHARSTEQQQVYIVEALVNGRRPIPRSRIAWLGPRLDFAVARTIPVRSSRTSPKFFFACAGHFGIMESAAN